MLIRNQPVLTENQVTPEPVYHNRRAFLSQAVAAGAVFSGGALASGLSGCGQRDADTVMAANSPYPDLQKSYLSTDDPPTDQELVTAYVNFYEFGMDKYSPVEKAQALQTNPWSIEVTGECHKPGTYTLEDILKPHSLEERIYRFRCVETWAAVIPWTGFPLGDLLRRFEPTDNAKFVQFFTLLDPQVMPGVMNRVLDWPYREGLRMDEAMHPLTLAAVGMYGATLPKQNGAPIRLVVPWKYGFKSIKSIVKIAFTETKPQTAWNMSVPQEYGFYANVNPEVPHPRWSQARETRLGELMKRDTEKFNGYGEAVAALYTGMDLTKNY